MTVSFIAVLLYVLSGQVILEKIPATDLADCQIKAGKRIEQLNENPKLDGGLYAGCVAVNQPPVQKQYHQTN